MLKVLLRMWETPSVQAAPIARRLVSYMIQKEQLKNLKALREEIAKTELIQAKYRMTEEDGRCCYCAVGLAGKMCGVDEELAADNDTAIHAIDESVVDKIKDYFGFSNKDLEKLQDKNDGTEEAMRPLWNSDPKTRVLPFLDRIIEEEEADLGRIQGVLRNTFAQNAKANIADLPYNI